MTSYGGQKNNVFDKSKMCLGDNFHLFAPFRCQVAGSLFYRFLMKLYREILSSAPSDIIENCAEIMKLLMFISQEHVTM